MDTPKKILLGQQASVDAQDATGHTAARLPRGHHATAKILIDGGADTTNAPCAACKRGHFGGMVVHYAAMCGRADVVKTLLGLEEEEEEDEKKDSDAEACVPSVEACVGLQVAMSCSVWLV